MVRERLRVNFVVGVIVVLNGGLALTSGELDPFRCLILIGCGVILLLHWFFIPFPK